MPRSFESAESRQYIHISFTVSKIYYFESYNSSAELVKDENG